MWSIKKTKQTTYFPIPLSQNYRNQEKKNSPQKAENHKWHHTKKEKNLISP